MHDLLTFASAAIVIISPIPYIFDIVRNKTHPNIVTWITWSIINGINAAAAFYTGAWQTGVYTLCGFVATMTIVALGVRHGVKKYTRFDITCQVVALLGIPLWLLTKQPGLAVLVILLVDFSGGLPTLRHAWRAPFEETLQTFLYSAIAGALLLLSLTEYSFVAVTMPLYILLFDSAIVFSIIYRRREMGEAAVFSVRH